MSLINYFPFQNIRNNQSKVCNEIEDCIKSNIKYIFLEAPTGFGKSPIAITLASYLGSSHICTSTKDLQNQYSKDFHFIKEAKGKRNFICILKEIEGIHETCEYGPCQKEEEFDCVYKTRLSDYKVNGLGTKFENVNIGQFEKMKYIKKYEKQLRFDNLEWEPCKYFHQKWISTKSSHTIYNYKYFLSDFYFSNFITKRELLVFDEVHNIESEISDFKSFIINNDNITRLFPKLKLPTIKEEEIETWIDFCEEYRDTLLDFIQDIESAIEINNLKEPYTEKNLIDCINKEKNLHFVLNDMKSNKNNWLVTNIDRKSRDSIKKITLTPLDISTYFKEILDLSNYGLFMSATILNKEYLCKISGLSEDEIKFIRIKKSDFPKENRPIHLMNVAWLNSKNMMENLPTIAKTVNNIMSIHKNEKGIIHTTSYFQLEFIKNNLNKENLGRLIETSPNTDRIEILQRHIRDSKPTVLISPSFYQGLDLKDDLSRFQIIIKIPYPDLSDKKVAALRKKDMNWYLWNTVVRLTQTYGRSIRSKDDHASTYILDSNINYLLRNANEMFPAWFTEAITYKK
ncbi:MAG TPA: helicase C-terminal domain-containing protein [Nitrososphaeraceae archaeon]|nr:helicase C-terminal domain-containing protein [Nitrososphaeraceae archaeon]